MSNNAIVEIRIGYSLSKYYEKSIALAKAIGNYRYFEDAHIIVIADILEFFKKEREIVSLIEIVYRWKNTQIFFCGQKCESLGDFFVYLKNFGEANQQYKPIINSYYTTVGNGSITVEELPLPVVYYPVLYGCFFVFSKNIDSTLYFCECTRDTIKNYFNFLQNTSEHVIHNLNDKLFPPIISEQFKNWDEPLINHIYFQEKICFACNKQIPKLSYCLPMYGGKFQQKYGWYKRQEMLRLYIALNTEAGVDKLIEDYPPELYDDLKQLQYLFKLGEDNLYSKIERVTENKTRLKFGFKKIGEAWVSETIMFNIIEKIYKSKKTIRHYRPDWLEGLEIDIYVPDEKIGFEYQGIQHFKPIEHWGGIEQLKKQQEHDARKKQLCETRGIKLICVNYCENLTYEHILQRIQTENF